MEIELGHYSDMPGVDVEATHRVINKMLGTSSCGEEFAERLGRWASASLQP
jgi:hypothetical protein